MRRTLIVITLVFFSNSCISSPSNRNEVYAKQLDCATQKTLESSAGRLLYTQEDAEQAATDCVTKQDMADVYRGALNYWERNPETVKKEWNERINYLIEE